MDEQTTDQFPAEDHIIAPISASSLSRTYTLEEFWQLSDPPDRSKLELIAGVLYLTPPPEQIHDTVVTRLVRSLIVYLDNKGDRGSLYVPRAALWTSKHTHLEPDLFYVSAELEAQLDPERRTTADLVIEVISPGSTIYDRNTKADTYGALGVRELWLVDEAAKTIEVKTQTGDGAFAEGRVFEGGDMIDSEVFPDLRISVERIFADE